MPQLKDILYKASLKSTSGDTFVEINAIQFDSRKVEQGDVFVAVRGVHVDGHNFIEKALELGAKAIVCESLPKVFKEGVTYIEVEDSSEAMGIMASNFYGNPSSKLKLIGITGTNGKTSSVTLLQRLFMELGHSVGMLSTVENKIDDEVIPSTHTTPDAVSINVLLSKMVKAGCTYCFMEVSSHAIVQRRIAGLDFAIAIFSNISHDHLDYHKTFDEYIRAKKLFFDHLPKSAYALVNVDDKRGRVMVQNTKAEVKTYGIRLMADFKAKVLSNTLQGLELDINGKTGWFRLIGEFNAYNLLAVYSVAVLMEEDEEEVLTVLSAIENARGRFEQIMSDHHITAIVDYAHTPDALENVLKTIAGFKGGNKILTVVGCGGDRDKTKRPEMAAIACKYSDKVVLTSDNPRTEDPKEILKEMEAGVTIPNKRKTLTIEDRKEAIKTACSLAEDGDVILVAGKGHETYQEINGVKHPFDDRKVIEETFKLLGI